MKYIKKITDEDFNLKVFHLIILGIGMRQEV